MLTNFVPPRWSITLLIAALVPACAPRTPAADTTTQPNPERRREVASVMTIFSAPRDSAALARFQPAREAAETGGECMVRSAPAPGVRILTAYFPSRTESESMVSVTVDPTGRLLRYSENRGLTRLPGLVGATTPAARDSAFAAARQRTRSTHIFLDYVTGQAIITNEGGGQGTEAAAGSVEQFEKLDKLGFPHQRVERVRALCAGAKPIS